MEEQALTASTDRVCRATCSANCETCVSSEQPSVCMSCNQGFFLVDGACASLCPAHAPIADARLRRCLACSRGTALTRSSSGVESCLTCDSASCYQCGGTALQQCTACHISEVCVLQTLQERKQRWAKETVQRAMRQSEKEKSWSSTDGGRGRRALYTGEISNCR